VNGIILIAAFVLAASATFVTNWLALIPWRRNRDKHWTEQARLVYPVFVAARSNLLFVPGIITLAVWMMRADSFPLWLFAGIFAMAGATAGTLFLSLEVFPRTSVPDLLREAAADWLMRFLIWLIFIAAAVEMPDKFNLSALGLGILVVLLWVLRASGGWVWLGKTIGLFVPAPERLINIVRKMSTMMNIPCRNVLLVRSSRSQAYALPDIRLLLFTRRLLELSSDDEIRAICAHELAHLTESRAISYLRSIKTLAYLPWVFFNPLIHAAGFGAVWFLLFISFVVPRIYSKVSRKLESRADAMAKANEPDDGVYARALARLYEDNLAPAVTARKLTHPHLYERLLASGITPDFPRPKPAQTIAWNGIMFAGLGGIVLGMFAAHVIGYINGAN